MAKPDDDLIELAGDILDGMPVNWEATRTNRQFDSTILAQLQLLSLLADVHRPQPIPTDREHPALAGIDPSSLPRWGHLLLLERVGSGSFGDVFRAWDTKLEREVALKLTDAASPVLGIEEGRLLARVRHPNVVAVYGAERLGSHIGIWTEFIHGKTLEQLLAKGPFLASDARAIGAEVCSALSAVHDAGLLHRDIKAQNVMREDGGRIVLMDFGAGTDRVTEQRLESGTLAGTPLYAAPELLAGGRPTPQSDIYSVGVLLFHLVTASFPVSGGSLDEIADGHRTGRRVKLADARPHLPSQFIAIVEQAIDADPSRRFATAAAFRESLSALAFEQPVSAPAPRRASWLSGAAAVAAAVLTIMALSTAFVSWPRPISSPVSFRARDWVLVTPFENRTGEALLDDTIEFAFERELAISSFVNIVPRERVDDAFQLMRKPTTTPIDLPVAREIALRDGGIRALIHGRIEKMGAHYHLVAQIINPGDGSVRATVDESVPESSGLLAAVRREALAIRTALGEERDTLAASARTLERVTTRSLRALQLYSRAAALMHGPGIWNVAAAEQLLRDSLNEEPDFASAHILLAWAVRAQARAAAEYLPHADEALRLAESLPDVERYFIIGSVHQMRSETAASRRDELIKAAAAYDALLTGHPDHLWALGNLRGVYSQLGRVEDASRLEVRMAAVQPNDFRTVATLAQTYFENGDLVNAERYFSKAEPLLATLPSVAPPSFLSRLASSVRLFRAQDCWLHNDIVAARKYVDAAAHELDTLGAGYHVDMADRLAKMYLQLGAFDRAEDFARMIADDTPSDADHRAAVIALVLWQEDDRVRLRQHLDSSVRNGRSAGYKDYVDGLINMKMFKEAREATERFVRNIPQMDDVALKKNLGYVDEREALESAIADRRLHLPADAEASVRSYSDGAPIWIGYTLTLAGRLADALESRGETARAIALLESLTSPPTSRVKAAAQFRGSEWMANRARLGALYRRSGRDREAASIEAQLKTLQSTADKGAASEH